MLGFNLIDSDEGESIIFLFFHELSSAMYADKFTFAIEAGCQPARVKSQHIECSQR